MERKASFWVVLMAVGVLCSACGVDDYSSPEVGTATKPPPQVRVELLPTLTPLPTVVPTEVVLTSTPEPTAQILFWTPPSSEDLATQIDSIMNEMEQKLKSQNINIKP